MNLIPRSPMAEFESFFKDPFPTFRLLPEVKADSTHLAVDIKERKNSYLVKADFPGIKKEDISINVENSVLTISAEYEEEAEEKEDGKLIRQERRYGKYSRSFTLGDDVDESKINASINNGVLSLDIPKSSKKESGSKKISVS